MGKWARIKRMATGLSMVVLLWFIYSVSRLAFHVPGQDHYAYLPENADLVLVVNTKALFTQGAEDLMLREKDQKLVDLLLEEWENRSREMQGRETGIDLTADMIWFSVREDSRPISGLLFSLSDPQAFRANSPSLTDPDLEAFALTGNVGLILHQFDLHFSKKQLARIARRLLSGKHLPVQTLNQDRDGFISRLFIRNEEGNHPARTFSDLSMQLTAEGIAFSGDIHVDFENAVQHGFQTLPKEGLHLSSRILPPGLFQPDDLGLPSIFPEPAGISLNFRGSEIVEGVGVELVPDADALIWFRNEIDLNTILDSLAARELISRRGPEQFMYGKRLFHAHQLQDRQIYIGRTAYTASSLKSSNDYFLVSGDLSTLTHVEGNGFVRRFLEMVSAYTAGRDFTESTESIELTLEPSGRNTARLQGKLRMKEGHFATLELLRLALSGKLF